MDKDDVIRQLDRQLKIRAMFAFERQLGSARDAERDFVGSARDLVRRQPAMAHVTALPELLLSSKMFGEA